MPYNPSAKDGLLIPSGPEGFHLHIILTDICKDGRHLVGNITSIDKNEYHDPTCEIQKGEHKFVKHPSYFLFRKIRLVAASHIIKCVTGWEFKKHDPLTNALFQRICDGIEKSDHTPDDIIEYWKNNKP